MLDSFIFFFFFHGRVPSRVDMSNYTHPFDPSGHTMVETCFSTGQNRLKQLVITTITAGETTRITFSGKTNQIEFNG